MPIRRELRYFYPIDWPQLSALVRFRRAEGRCERCGRPHSRTVHHLGDDRWWDGERETWRDGRGREVAPPGYAEYRRLSGGRSAALGGIQRATSAVQQLGRGLTTLEQGQPEPDDHISKNHDRCLSGPW